MEGEDREGEERALRGDIQAASFPKTLRNTTETRPQCSPVKPVASAVLAALCETGLEDFNLLGHSLQTPAQAAD